MLTYHKFDSYKKKITHSSFQDGWKRKSTKNKRLLFLHKTSCESTSNDTKTPPSVGQLTNDLSPSITSVNNYEFIEIFIQLFIYVEQCSINAVIEERDKTTSSSQNNRGILF